MISYSTDLCSQIEISQRDVYTNHDRNVDNFLRNRKEKDFNQFHQLNHSRNDKKRIIKITYYLTFSTIFDATKQK